jgi:hypothetical protein
VRKGLENVVEKQKEKKSKFKAMEVNIWTIL